MVGNQALTDNSFGLRQLAMCQKEVLGRGSFRKSKKAYGEDGGNRKKDNEPVADQVNGQGRGH